jgi:predicted lysophospholipase L1 biosynthesis ABC-type transport system permease subunit
MAERHWPGQDAIGKRFQMGGPGSKRPMMTIVGIVKTSRHNGILEAPRAEMFLPHSQVPDSAGSPGRAMAVVLKTAGEPLQLAGPLRDTVRSLDRSLPVADVRPMTELTGDALAAPRFASLLLGMFAALALALAAIGTYAVISLLVTEQRKDIGIRMALGAERRTILTSVLREGAVLGVAGTAIGLGGASIFSRLMESLLYDVRPLDPLTFAAAPAVLIAIALIASVIPARRAASIDPVNALRFRG